jgi:hypothetical protein
MKEGDGMDDNGFWAIFIKIVGAVSIALILGLSGGGSYNSYLVGEAIKNGAHPIDASCALKHWSTNSPCAIRASK